MGAGGSGGKAGGGFGGSTNAGVPGMSYGGNSGTYGDRSGTRGGGVPPRYRNEVNSGTKPPSGEAGGRGK